MPKGTSKHGIDRLLSLASPALHPILFSLYPILALLSTNMQEIAPDQVRRSLIAVPAAAVILIGVFYLLLRDGHRASAVASATVLVLSSYGHVYLLLERVRVAGIILGRHRHLIPLALLGLLILLLWLWRARPDLRPVTPILNLVGASAVALCLLSIGVTMHRIRSDATSASLTSVMLQTHLDPPKGAPLPDVYYIILDGYARSDYMQSVFGYDNSAFIAFLESRGFYVAEDSHSNHSSTALSLASSLNLTYAQNLGLRLVRGSYPGIFVGSIRDSVVRENFERMGYEIVGFRSGYVVTEWINADRFLAPDEVNLKKLQGPLRANAFESMLLKGSAGLIMTDLFGEQLRNWTRSHTSQPHDLLRQIVLYQLDTLPAMAATPVPKFVFAHIISPHPPYLFGANGEAPGQTEAFTLLESDETGSSGSSGSRIDRYADQAAYITARVEEAIDGILENSATPPIIIVQADHGPLGRSTWPRDTGIGMRLRMSILNAYLLPAGCERQLYPEITPVNSFRVVFNCAFDADYPLMPDDSYYSPSPYSGDYSFRRVNDELD